MAIMLNARSNVYEHIFFSASQPPDSSTLSQIAGIADSGPYERRRQCCAGASSARFDVLRAGARRDGNRRRRRDTAASSPQEHESAVSVSCARPSSVREHLLPEAEPVPKHLIAESRRADRAAPASPRVSTPPSSWPATTTGVLITIDSARPSRAAPVRNRRRGTGSRPDTGTPVAPAPRFPETRPLVRREPPSCRVRSAPIRRCGLVGERARPASADGC